MEIHWINLDGLEEKDRQVAEDKFRKLGASHNDLIDLRIMGKKNGTPSPLRARRSGSPAWPAVERSSLPGAPTRWDAPFTMPSKPSNGRSGGSASAAVTAAGGRGRTEKESETG